MMNCYERNRHGKHSCGESEGRGFSCLKDWWLNMAALIMILIDSLLIILCSLTCKGLFVSIALFYKKKKL
jgi:hypothetical protein